MSFPDVKNNTVPLVLGIQIITKMAPLVVDGVWTFAAILALLEFIQWIETNLSARIWALISLL